MNGDRLHADADTDTDEVPQDDVVVSLICSAIALTMAGLVALLLVWR